MNEEQKPAEVVVEHLQSPRLDVLRKRMDENRAQHVSEIFQIYDQLPEMLKEFKVEGITEAEAVTRLGILVENVLKSYEISQIPMIFESIKEKEHIRNENVSQLVSSAGQPIKANTTPSGLYLP